MPKQLLGAIQQIEQAAAVLTPFMLLFLVGTVFIISPFSNILNAITVPLGYEWQSCPNCPDVGIKKIEHAECAHCGEQHATNFGAAKYRDGERISFCSNDCLDRFKEESADA